MGKTPHAMGQPRKEAQLATLAVIAFNQENVVGEAVAAALAQTYSPLEIILSDDGSTDGTFEVMQRMAAAYEGPHKIIINRNASNLNIGQHVNKVGRLASGELVVLGAGDDISLPHRVERLMQHWQALGHPSAVLVSDFQPMDRQSRPVDLRRESTYRGPFTLQDMARGWVRVLGATTAVTRDVFARFAPMDPSVRHEDRVLPFRALLLGGVVSVLEEKLVRYRIEGGVSRKTPKSGTDYLYRYTPEHLNRILPDALQRLQDARSLAPPDSLIVKACLATVAEHRAHIEMAGSRDWRLEACSLRWMANGARPAVILPHYLKMRFLRLFDAYFRRRHAAF